MHAFPKLSVSLIIAAGVCVPSARAEAPRARATDFEVHLDTIAPVLLHETGVPGMAVGVLINGQVTTLRTYGVANLQTDAPVDTATIFNAGSISKPITAWTVLSLVEDGLLDLDAPVQNYVPEWTPHHEGFSATSITLRMLLSHTSGLSMSAVPEFPPAEALPSLDEAIVGPDSEIRIVAAPGEAWSYSGGGYSVLQLVIERVTGRRFEDVVRERVFEPLSMRRSSFSWNDRRQRHAATPYDSGASTDYFRYWGRAAAAFNTTIKDLARFAAANLTGLRAGEHLPPGLRSATIQLSHVPSPNTEQNFGIRYGLGFEIWNLRGGGRIVGHNGQNTGWGATMWVAPETGDGLVILTNDSSGRDAWKWILCDWAYWISETSWYGMCTDRPEYLPSAPSPRRYDSPPVDTPEGNLSFVDQKFSRAFPNDGPGAAVLIAQGGTVLHNSGHGLAEVESGALITPDTPFNLASVSKLFTALAVARQVEEGWLRYDDRLGVLLPELPESYAEIQVDQLLQHTSGIADYHPWVRWREIDGLDNDDVLALLRDHPDLEFSPGERSAYSNTGYVLLSTILSRASGESYSELLERLFLAPLSLENSFVHESRKDSKRPHAFGYALVNGSPVPRDHALYRLGDGSTRSTGFLTTGSGGVYSSTRDLHALVRAFFDDELVQSETRDALLVPRVAALDLEGLGDTPQYARGWLVSDLYGSRAYWQDGANVGARTFVMHIPAYDFTVIILSNLGAAEPRRMAMEIADRLLAAK